MTLPKKVLAVILPLGLGAALAIAQSTNTSAPPTQPTDQAQATAPDSTQPPTTTPSPAAAPVTDEGTKSNADNQPMTAEPATQSAASSSAATEPAAAGAAPSQHLPKTASDVPLLGLAGFLALGAGLGLRALRH
ncbi:MAG: hypothetical protein ACM3OB_04595 [Acidobacteriota bacterium]